MPEAARQEELLIALLRRQQETGFEIKPTCAPQFVRLAEQLGIETRFPTGCLAGRTYCVITPNGDVHPCPYLPVLAGNVRQQAFSEIWREAEAFHTLRAGRPEGKCGACRWGARCFGCPARAYWATGGEMMAEDPWCGAKAES